MTGTNCDLFTHNQSRSYLNHLVFLCIISIVITHTVPENCQIIFSPYFNFNAQKYAYVCDPLQTKFDTFTTFFPTTAIKHTCFIDLDQTPCFAF
jgi:hypothetical protein